MHTVHVGGRQWGDASDKFGCATEEEEEVERERRRGNTNLTEGEEKQGIRLHQQVSRDRDFVSVELEKSYEIDSKLS